MIVLDDVTFSYDNGTVALDGLSLHVRAGEFACILGPNGSGKSTLAKHINGLLAPDSGRVLVDGTDASDPHGAVLACGEVGMVFQNPDDQMVASRVQDEVAFGPENLGVAMPQLADRVTHALAQVGLQGFEQRRVSELSGGQKQRVAVAGALAMDPKVLVLDEATSMLDPRGKADLLHICQTLRDRGITILMVTQFMEEAACADTVYVLDRGSLVMEGTPSQVLTNIDALDGLGLKPPFACCMSQALQARGVPVGLHVREEALVDDIVRVLESDGAPMLEGGEARGDERFVAHAAFGDSHPVAHGDREAASEGEPHPRSAMIEFDQVSYSYTHPADSGRRKRRRRDGAGDPCTPASNPDVPWALRDVSFVLHEGEFLGLAGPTGSGKSTLLSHMNGLLHPTCGRVLVQGHDIAQPEAARGARELVGLVFQYPERQLFAASVYDDISFGPRNMGLSEDEVSQRYVQAMGQVGLDADGLRDASPFELSGGQQRRVAIAGVLAMRPRCLVLDEPGAGLDPASRTSLLALIDRLRLDQGLTVVMASHDMDDLARMCDRILVLDDGRPMLLGSASDVFSHQAALEAIGLSVPAPQRLAARLQQRGVELCSQHTLYTVHTLADAVVGCLHG